MPFLVANFISSHCNRGLSVNRCAPRWQSLAASLTPLRIGGQSQRSMAQVCKSSLPPRTGLSDRAYSDRPIHFKRNPRTQGGMKTRSTAVDEIFEGLATTDSIVEDHQKALS